MFILFPIYVNFQANNSQELENSGGHSKGLIFINVIH